ncbi:MAG: hypothetical protein HY908_11130 [Myxococcales bacterium]|nr:hypothetical protein [Myxococcales bacterium]
MQALFGLQTLHQALDYHVARHNLLSANLAHVDTPGFRPVDLYRRDGFAGALALELAGTDAAHLGARAAAPWAVEIDPNCPAGADGNAVDLDREAVKIASNNLRYEAVAALVRDRLAQLDFASRDGR